MKESKENPSLSEISGAQARGEVNLPPVIFSENLRRITGWSTPEDVTEGYKKITHFSELFCQKEDNPKAEAENLAHEVIIRLCLSQSPYTGKNNADFNSWLYKTVQNCYWDLKRRNRVNFRNHHKAAAPEEYEHLPDPKIGIEKHLVNSELVDKLMRVLTKREKQMMLWREVEGCDIKEISGRTGVPENTIKVILFRAREKMQKEMKRLQKIENRQ